MALTLPQWQHVLLQIARERPIYRACAEATETCPTKSAAAWQAMLKSEVGQRPFDQIQVVNQFLNQWQYKTDEQNYGQRDYWATPLEFLRRSGDCEDYAIAKYVSLRQLGFAAEDLRLVVLRDIVRDLPHAVLAVYLKGEVYILDNLTTAVLPQEQLSQTSPTTRSTRRRAGPTCRRPTRWSRRAPPGCRRRASAAAERAPPRAVPS
jgi:predicted transglutaminase-like cysteine proteinase